MKKIFTLVAGMLLTAAVFAADRKPVVTINSSKNYKIVIDGKNYFGDNITLRLDDYFKRNHTIKVFEMRRGLYVKGERLVDAATFRVDRNDVAITIDRFGNIRIREIRGRGHSGWNDKGYDHDNRF
ncbi:MAG TPA: hypothetical protein VK483_18325 [Chitinophagaceae bacterium]|nr:hypothetical protein [Chitinophagaceae bacterium]